MFRNNFLFIIKLSQFNLYIFNCYFQGFHLLADIYDGFGGLASSVASDLADEFSKKGCVAFCPFPSLRETQVSSLEYGAFISALI